jgi:hypothetical protein
LREKFNLNWPLYDGRFLRRYPSPALRGQHEREVTRSDWHKEPFVIASSQLMRRRERQIARLPLFAPIQVQCWGDFSGGVVASG